LATRNPRGGGPIPSPFTIQVDTREQLGYQFNGIETNADQGGRIVSVARKREVVRNGDYTIVGMGARLGVERKTKEDLYGSVGRRDNFEGRLERMDAIRRADTAAYFAIVVESELGDCLLNPPKRRYWCEKRDQYVDVRMGPHPKSLNRTILAWRQRYLVDWFFLPSREFAEQYTYRILERFWLDHCAE
jgi:hypothetical protein